MYIYYSCVNSRLKGKTTLFNAICGLTGCVRGSIFINGCDMVKNLWKICEKRSVGYVPQCGGLLDALNVRETLDLFATLSQRSINHDALFRSGIVSPAILNVPVKALSGGHKKRLLVAIATMCDPAALLIDEATSGVDIDAGLAICDYLKQICLSQQALVFSSHRMEESIGLCDRVIFLRKGKVAYEDNTSRISQRMNSFYVVDIFLVDDGEDEVSTSLHRLIQVKLYELGIRYFSASSIYYESCTTFSKTFFRLVCSKERTPLSILWRALELSSFVSAFFFRDVLLEEWVSTLLSPDDLQS